MAKAPVAHLIVGFEESYETSPKWYQNYMSDKVSGEIERIAEKRLDDFDENIFWVDDKSCTYYFGVEIDRAGDAYAVEPWSVDEIDEAFLDAEGNVAELYYEFFGYEPQSRPQIFLIMN